MDYIVTCLVVMYLQLEVCEFEFLVNRIIKNKYLYDMILVSLSSIKNC